MKRSVEDDTHHRVERVRRKLLRSRHEIARRIVDQGIDFAELLFSGRKCSFDG